MLLDSESTIDIITKKSMVSNIKRLESPITLHFNMGSRQVEYTVYLNGYGRVWYDSKEIVNILSLYHATRNYRVVFYREDDNYFRMMFPGREVVLKVSTDYIYYRIVV